MNVQNEITHRRVLTIALPIVLSNATVPLLGLVDTGVVGQLDDPIPIGAVGVGAIILNASYWFFGFLRMGTAGLAAQAYGGRNLVEVNALLWRVLMIGLMAGLGFILCQSLLFSAAFQVSPASAEVETLAREYMSIRIYSAPATIAIYGIVGWLIAAERTRAVLVLQLVMNIINIALDVLFVIQFEQGVAGVAYASVIAEWGGLILGVWLCREALRPSHLPSLRVIFDTKRLAFMMRANTDIMLRSMLMQAVFISFVFQGAVFGDDILAANQILLQFLYVTAYAMDGFAFAGETLVGKAFGAGQPHFIRQAAKRATLWAAVTGVLLALGFAVLGPFVIEIMSENERVRALSLTFLPYMALAPILGLGAWMLDGVFIGATRTADMRNMMFLSVVIYFATLPLFVAWLGNHGLWLALLMNFIVRALTLWSRYPSLEAQAMKVVKTA